MDFRRKSGEIIPEHMSGEIIRLDGKSCILSIITDISDFRKAEKTIEKERNRLLTIINTLPDPIYFKDSKSRFEIVNNATVKVLNKSSQEEVIGKTDLDLLPADIANELFKEEQDIIKTGIPLLNEEMSSEESKYWTLRTKVPLRDNNDKIIRLVCINNNVYKQKQIEMELQRLRSYFKNVIDSMPSILIGVDKDGIIEQLNKEGEKFTGLSSEEAAGRKFADICPGFQCDSVKIRKAIKSRKIIKDEKIEALLNKNKHYFDMTIYPLRDKYSESAVIRIDDVTDRIRIEELMIQSEKMMTVGSLAAGMAHEINNPLAGILQSSQVALERILPDKEENIQAAGESGIDINSLNKYMEKQRIRQFLEGIVESGRRASRIVESMLNFSRRSK